ncbi:MAG: aspartate aminotransferase family protein [Alphaproteobacteria bacterium]|jgi:adenosylmethionine-8-amino-7-oxononanoate aminotransferase|nr:aspartate aminotransferase family protein [Pseudomonadota bacterium]MDG1465596.1 aspartate aminotransferase family protein [Alphaproteobacteria bacterium]MDG2457901.1 aspartate aminotransferase family protein [Alphaproteobacteria bacterium]|tara:strand:+ start:564 stop:1898 length:1335 start_codon:yes stop_codon:yes gene_type:complete
MRKSNVFPRHSSYDLPNAVGGDGCYIIDEKGKRYLDASGGAAVSCLGHSDKTIQKAIIEQTEKLAFAHTSFFTSEPAELLANLLAKHSPEGLDKVYFVSSGSEAVEASLKLARQYFVEIGKPEKHKVISRKQSYHGNTLGALAAGGNIWRRSFFEKLLVETSLISPCYPYRHQTQDETELEYGLRVANELEEEIINLGSENVMAFIAETVVGATAGALTPVSGYFKRVREICDKYDVLLILDEVMCGMGRTGSLFACDDEDVVPDILTVAKGLGAGYQPIGAMICQNFIYDAIANGSGFFQHGHTYLGHPVACAASLSVLNKLVNENFSSQVKEKGQYLQKNLELHLGQNQFVGDIRGRGLFRGIEIVKDRSTKEPFQKKLNIAGKIKKQALDIGLICYPMQGTVDGSKGDHILIAPPFIINESEINEISTKLKSTIDLVCNQV